MRAAQAKYAKTEKYKAARDDKHARAILCNGCNLALGHIKDNIPRLQALVGYLEKINGAAEA
jgi:hypothetical protein